MKNLKKSPGFMLLVLIFCAVHSAPLFAQALAEADTLPKLDGEVRRLGILIAADLNRRNAEIRVRTGIFTLTLHDAEPPLGVYWKEQISTALSETAEKKFLLLEPESSRPERGGAADYEISGEFMEAGEMVRVYTRLIRLPDGVLERSWTTDLRINDFIAELLESPSQGSAPLVRRDSHEEDSMEAPVEIEIGGDWVSRTIHRGDTDWFRVTPAAAGLLVLETGGEMDTFMDLYNGDSLSRIAENDDGGDGGNARIEYTVEGGRSYIAKIRPYDSGDTGAYRFRAFMESIPEDTFEPNDDMESAGVIKLNEAVESYFHTDDVDWYLVEIPSAGPVTVYTESRVDTLLTIYDAEGRELDSDDDSGSGGNARIRLNLPAGTFYIEVSEYDGSRGRYTLHVKRE